MEFYEVVEKRRTTRQFKDKPVEKEKIERIIAAGVKAPSFDHKRKWNFIVVTDREAKERALASIEPLPFAFDAPQNPAQEMIKIAFPKQKTMFQEAGCLLLPVFKREAKIQGENMTRSTMDIAEMWCVIENIFLAAVNEGLSCAMRVPHRDQPRQVLEAVGCPDNYHLLCMIGVGYAADNAEYPVQTYPELSQCVHWDRW